METAHTPAVDEVWAWLEDVPDPEIPVLSVVDLGVIRDVRWDGGTLAVVITPTYSGCPAMQFIHESVRRALESHGVESVRMESRLSPAWTTDWLSERGRERLRAYGIAPPVGRAGALAGLSRGTPGGAKVTCPHCDSADTQRVSQFGSTPCKALYRCNACREPFEYFKCH